MSVNLNTVLTGLVGAVALALLSNGVDINKTIIELKMAQKQMTEKQDSLAKRMEDVMPRAELETRFKALETQVLEIKVRVQASELEIIKMRDSSRH